MKTFNTFVENLDDIRQKLIDKKDQKRQADQQRKADQEDDKQLAQDTARETGDDIKRKLKNRYNIDVD